MLASEVLTHVRDTLQDFEEPKRYTDASLLRALNLCLLELRYKRPDLFIGTFTENTPQAAALSDDVRVPEIAIPGIVAYIAGWVEMRDDEYTTDGRAAALMGKFGRDMVG